MRQGVHLHNVLFESEQAFTWTMFCQNQERPPSKQKASDTCCLFGGHLASSNATTIAKSLTWGDIFGSTSSFNSTPGCLMFFPFPCAPLNAACVGHQMFCLAPRCDAVVQRFATMKIQLHCRDLQCKRAQDEISIVCMVGLKSMTSHYYTPSMFSVLRRCEHVPFEPEDYGLHACQHQLCNCKSNRLNI